MFEVEQNRLLSISSDSLIKCSKASCSWTLSSQHVLTCFSDGKSTTWSVRLGQLLLSAKKRDTTTFYDTLKLVRAEQIVPLSAASFERGSYQRGYEFIVRYFWDTTFMFLLYICHLGQFLHVNNLIMFLVYCLTIQIGSFILF